MTIRGIISLASTTTISGTVYPNLPNGWRAQPESNNWYSIINDNNNDNFFHARLMVTDSNFPNLGVFALVGEKERIRSVYLWLSSSGKDVWTLQQLKDDTSTKAKRIKQDWLALNEMSGSSMISIKATMAGFDYEMGMGDTETLNELTGS